MILFPSSVRRAVMHKREGKRGIKEDKNSSSGEIFLEKISIPGEGAEEEHTSPLRTTS